MSVPCLPVSHRKKRKRNETPPILAPSNGSDNDDDNDAASFSDIQNMDAAEYLSRVVSQAKELPDVVVAAATNDEDVIPKRNENHVPIDGSAASLLYLVSGRASLTRPPSDEYLPKHSVEWIAETLGNFERLREYIEGCRSQGIGGKLTRRTAFPPMKDRSGWHMFCVGSDEAHGNINSYFGDDYHEHTSETGRGAIEDADQSLPEWQKYVPPSGYPPSVRLLAQMDQVLVRRVISHLSHYACQGWKLTAQRSAWIYALLARLEKPIHRDDASTLFGFLKLLTLSRSKLSLEGNVNVDLARHNVLIALIGIYFEQGANTVMSIE